MSTSVAIFTSDANLLRCQVDVIRRRLRPLADAGRLPASVGLAYVEADNILLRKKPGDVGTLDVRELVKDVVSEVLLFHVSGSQPRPYADEDAMPLRYRRWMFMHHGLLGAPAQSRLALLGTLPEFLQRQLKGSSPAEVCFLSFFARLRDHGCSEEFDIATPLVARLLGGTVRAVEKVEREAGRLGELSFFATNGRVLAASRLNSEPLHYALMEGISRCERCQIDETTPDSNPLLRAHRRVRAVVLATGVANPAGFMEVPEASVVTVAHNLDVQVAPL